MKFKIGDKVVFIGDNNDYSKYNIYSPSTHNKNYDHLKYQIFKIVHGYNTSTTTIPPGAIITPFNPGASFSIYVLEPENKKIKDYPSNVSYLFLENCYMSFIEYRKKKLLKLNSL